MSLPNQNWADGGFNRLIGATACGSVVPSQGANIAIKIIINNTTAPTMAVG